MDAASPILIAAFFNAQLIRWGVWVGLVVLTIALLLLVRTRWGQSQPLGKCVVLSLVAHLLLGIYLTTVNIVSNTVGSPDGKGIQVALIDGTAGDETTTARDLGNSWDPHADNGVGHGFGEGGGWALGKSALEPITTTEPERHESAPVTSELPPINSLSPPTAQEVGPPEITAGREPPSLPASLKRPEPFETTPVPARENLVPPPEPLQPVEKTSGTPGGVDGESSTNPTAGDAIETPGVARPLAPIPGGGDGSGTGKAHAVPEVLEARISDHSAVAKGFGASQESEAAVNQSLRWLAAGQSANGRWDARRFGGGAGLASDGQDRQFAGMQADVAMTGLALLAFLGGGHTHLRGSYQSTVERGLEFLLSVQDASGNLGVSKNMYERMYSHAMATCALSEAYAMSGDARLQLAVRKAVGYTIYRQDKQTGGWRYNPGETGDTSQLGWQVMALKSAHLAGIPIPDETRRGITRFLRSVADGRDGGLARYQPPAPQNPLKPATRPMTAEALACRQFMDIMDTEAALNEACSFVLQEMPGVGKPNHYYWYYGSLALFQVQGEPWRKWNEALQKQLLATQQHDGDLAGSWDPDRVWGGCGGRIYSTALATLSLEVYYRFLPLVQAAGSPRNVK